MEQKLEKKSKEIINSLNGFSYNEIRELFHSTLKEIESKMKLL